MIYLYTRFNFDLIINFFYEIKFEGLIGSCFALAFIAIIYEALKLLRERIKKTKFRGQVYKINDSKSKMKKYLLNILSMKHIIQTFLHVLQFAIGYFLMLAFMTYNYWICLSILIGIGIGYFFFGATRESLDSGEDCAN